MELNASDGALLVYNYSVVLSGGAIVTSLNMDTQIRLLVVGLTVSVFWTVYFRFGMMSLIRPDPEPAE